MSALGIFTVACGGGGGGTQGTTLAKSQILHFPVLQDPKTWDPGKIDAEVQLNHRVLSVGKTERGRYRLSMMNGKGPESRDFDLVLMCLPHSWLATMRWEGEALRRSMVKHVAYFDRPAHYLRVALLFDQPFWGDRIPGAWFMSEAFGGCCVYVEGARHDVGRHGVLNFLIPGSDALAFANLNDEQLIQAALKSLPASLGKARDHFIEGKIHRWLSSVNAIPGGLPARDVLTNHRPEPRDHSGLVVVGDYMFDSTLNGLLDSSDAATDLILTEMMRLRYARGVLLNRRSRPKLPDGQALHSLASQFCVFQSRPLRVAP